MNSPAPPGLTQLAIFHLSTHYHVYPKSSSRRFSLILDICHTQRAIFSIKRFGAKLWNIISLEIKESVLVPSFRYNFTKHILSTNAREYRLAGFSLFFCKVHSALRLKIGDVLCIVMGCIL